MSVTHTICRPYAKAIFETALENNSIETWKKELILINTVVSYRNVRDFLSGSLSSKYLASFFITVCNGVINKNTENLIKLLAQNQRFNILNGILEYFLELEASYNKIIVVELKSAFSLEEKQIIKIRKILENLFLRKIKFLYKIDENILDGFIVKAKNTVFDLSVKNYLKQLSDALNF